jgi:hypothetical protein
MTSQQILLRVSDNNPPFARRETRKLSLPLRVVGAGCVCETFSTHRVPRQGFSLLGLMTQSNGPVALTGPHARGARQLFAAEGFRTGAGLFAAVPTGTSNQSGLMPMLDHIPVFLICKLRLNLPEFAVGVPTV